MKYTTNVLLEPLSLKYTLLGYFCTQITSYFCIHTGNFDVYYKIYSNQLYMFAYLNILFNEFECSSVTTTPPPPPLVVHLCYKKIVLWRQKRTCLPCWLKLYIFFLPLFFWHWPFFEIYYIFFSEKSIMIQNHLSKE